MAATQFAARLAELGEILDKRADFQASGDGQLIAAVTLTATFTIDRDNHVMVEVAADLKRPKRRSVRRPVYRIGGRWETMKEPEQGPLFPPKVVTPPTPLRAVEKQES